MALRPPIVNKGTFLNIPVQADFKNVLDFIPSRKIGRDITATVKGSQKQI